MSTIENLFYSTTEDQSLATALAADDPAARMITGAQIRAARGLLGWSAQELADHAGLSYPTVQRAEAIDGVPSLRAPNLLKIQRALETGGVIFIDADRAGGDGVRRRRS